MGISRFLFKKFYYLILIIMSIKIYIKKELFMLNNVNFFKVADFCGYVPFVSSATSLFLLFSKAVRPLLPSDVQSSRFFSYVKYQSCLRLLILLVPVLGNITVAIYDFIQKKREEELFAEGSE